MEKILLYTQTLDPKMLIEAVGDRAVTSVSSRMQLAETIVENKNLLCLLIEIDGLDEEVNQFLQSLRKQFPILNVGVITRDTKADLPEGYSRIDLRLEKDALAQELRHLLSSLAVTNRRAHNRFNFPLKGYLSTDGKSWREYPLSALSASGAFLECERDLPTPDTKGVLRIVFQNFKMVTQCEVLSPRHASSNFPIGFGVRFTDLTRASEVIIDQFVNEALVHSLVEPDYEAPTPSLEDDNLLTPNFEPG